MDYRTIQGVDGEIRLDKVILGASSFGANISKELSYQMMDRYYEIGGRTIDTARFYAMWIHNGISKSERQRRPGSDDDHYKRRTSGIP